MSSFRNEKLSQDARAAVLGFLACVFVFGPRVFDAGDLSWILGGDRASSLFGWLFSRNAGWSFPLGAAPDYVVPVGATLAFTDAMPLLGTLFKPWSHLLPAHFHFFGIWFLACWTLQGVFARRLMAIFTKDAWLMWIGTLLLCLSPALVFRVGHMSLCAHWLVLWALTLVLSRDPNRHPWWPRPAWVFIMLFSSGIHPYLTAMILGVAGLGHLPLFHDDARRRRAWLAAGSEFLILCAAAVLGFFAFGYLEKGNDSFSYGFGWYSADAFSFIHTGNYTLLPFPKLGAANYEGYSYLGLGVCALLFYLLWLRLKKAFVIWPALGTPHKRLLLACLALWVFALGSQIRFFGKWLVSLRFLYDHLSVITGPFRSGGRFIWPLYYLLMAAVIAVAGQFLVKRWGNAGRAIVVALALIQLIEMYPLFKTAHMRPSPVADRLRSPEWNELLKGRKHIALVPQLIVATKCGLETYGHDDSPYIPFALMAYEKGLTINSGSRSRPPVQTAEAACASALDELRSGQFRADTLYIVHPKFIGLFQENVSMIGGGGKPECKKIDEIHACSVPL